MQRRATRMRTEDQTAQWKLKRYIEECLDVYIVLSGKSLYFRYMKENSEMLIQIVLPEEEEKIEESDLYKMAPEEMKNYIEMLWKENTTSYIIII